MSLNHCGIRQTCEKDVYNMDTSVAQDHLYFVVFNLRCVACKVDGRNNCSKT